MKQFSRRRPHLNRRDVLQAGGFSAGLAGFSGMAANARPGHLNSAHVEISEATNITAAPSPDGKRIAFDLLGMLWLVGLDGGVAACLTNDGFTDIAYPCWSPDGDRIAFQSYQTGNFHIWMIGADGSGLTQLTNGFADHREPFFHPDGSSIYFSTDRTGRYAIHRLNLSSNEISQISHGESQDSEPCVAADGKWIAYVADGRRLILQEDNGAAQTVASVPDSKSWALWSKFYAPSFAPDGRLAHVQIVEGKASLHVGGEVVVEEEDIFPFRTGWLPDGGLVYASNGKIRKLDTSKVASEIPFTATVDIARPVYKQHRRDFKSERPRNALGITSPSLSPDGEHIAFGALNDIYVLTTGERTPRRITEGPHNKCYPAWSPDGKHLAYSADYSGTMDIWLHDLKTGAKRQLTDLPASAAVLPCWSPQGEQIAYMDQYGALHGVNVATGEVRQVHEALWLPGRPSFSPDGKKIALAAFKPVSGRFREGLSEILIVDLDTGESAYTPIAENKSIATRGDDGPVWSPDGKYLAYVFASTLWIQPITPDGDFAGAARQISHDVTDAPSWSGDGQKLLYLSNSKLRLTHLADGKTRTVPLRLRWSQAKAPEISVILHARIWDGLGPAYREGDVILRGNRIAGIAPPDSVTVDGMRIIDGGDLTLMPGLIDMHTHRQVHGSSYGARMGRALLAMGVTATRSPGGAAYHMAEDREAIDAGLRIAPRHFAAGEALDGSRIYYNFMRPVTEPGQLALELSRAKALDYDMIKTYVRMDNRTQAEVINAAHTMGMSVSSHYHYPSIRHGADAVEHLGATNRFGFSRTITALGAAYEDVSKVFAAAKAGRTTTLFAANALLPDYPDLIDDKRIHTLLPPWELTRFKALVQMISDTDLAPLLNALENNVAQIKSMMAEGWRVHIGTDAPIDTVGVSYHLNLRAMTRFGISAYDALLTATRYAGEFLDEPIGTIEPGQLADLILVEGDPLAEIADAARARTVIRDGKPYDMAALLDPYLPI